MPYKRTYDTKYENERAGLIRCLKKYHDASFTPGTYEHSVFGKAALLLEKTANAEEVVQCGECAQSTYSKTVACAYKCENRQSPCFGRTTYADFGCLYGEMRDGE